MYPKRVNIFLLVLNILVNHFQSGVDLVLQIYNLATHSC